MDALVEEAIELAEARSACTCEKCGALRSDTDIIGGNHDRMVTRGGEASLNLPSRSRTSIVRR
jgi:hypothetical protein